MSCRTDAHELASCVYGFRGAGRTMLELAKMKVLRDRQAQRLANAITESEPEQAIARGRKLLDDIDASLELFTKLKMPRPRSFLDPKQI